MSKIDEPRSPTVILREGALTELQPILAELSALRVFLVADPVAYEASGAADRLRGVWKPRQVTVFSEFGVNPKLAHVEQGAHLFREARPDVTIGIGGGTAIDLAKLIGTLANHSAPLVKLITGDAPITPGRVPLIAVPTTAGTGSEATHFAVVYHNDKKFSVAHPSLLPDFALVDPTLTYSMPKSITAATGLDALCQAVESMWAVGSTEKSLEFAARALRLTLAHLAAAVHQPTAESRRGMSEAALLSGQAINIGKTTAPHALSYWLSSRYGIPHGAAVAIFLGRMLEFNSQVTPADCNDPRGPQHVHKRIAELLHVLDVPDATAGRNKLEGLIAGVGCPVSLREVGVIDENDVWQLIGEVNTERLSNNPRKISPAQLYELLTTVTRP